MALRSLPSNQLQLQHHPLPLRRQLGPRRRTNHLLPYLEQQARESHLDNTAIKHINPHLPLHPASSSLIRNNEPMPLRQLLMLPVPMITARLIKVTSLHSPRMAIPRRLP